MLRLRMRSAIDVGTDSSPMRAPHSISICLTVARSDCGTPKSFFASSVTNFTVRSAPRTIAGAPAAMITLATLVIAGDADSTGNGSNGAFGNGSGSGAGAAAVAAPPERRVAVLSPAVFAATGGGGGGAGDRSAGGGVASFFAAVSFGLRGLSHFSQRIPRAIAAPHMKHFWAIDRTLDWRSYACFSCCCNVIASPPSWRAHETDRGHRRRHDGKRHRAHRRGLRFRRHAHRRRRGFPGARNVDDLVEPAARRRQGEDDRGRKAAGPRP